MAAVLVAETSENILKFFSYLDDRSIILIMEKLGYKRFRELRNSD